MLNAATQSTRWETRGESPGVDRDELLRLLNEAYHGPAWHGPSLRAALRGVSADEAAWRAGADRPTIWELALHAAYTKHRVVGRLLAPAPAFARKLARAWWPQPDAEASVHPEAAWRRDLDVLHQSHRRLVEAVAEVPIARLLARRRGSQRLLGAEVAGVALHDVYHAGQIRLLRRLHALGERAGSGPRQRARRRG